MPAALGRVLGVLRKLINYGKHLAATVQQRATAPGFDLLACPFGTLDVAIILARVTNGLRRAAALEAALLRRAASGRDLAPSPVRTPSVRTPRPARQVAPPTEAQPANHPRLANLPTEAEIAAAVRRRPIGAVIVDICLDLGIAPGQLDRAFWDELREAIIAYGGSLATFLGGMFKRQFAFATAVDAARAGPVHPPAPPRLPALATGPP